MAEETGARFERRVLGLQLRAWSIAVVGFVVGFAITAVLWPIVSGKDVQTVLTFLQTVLTFLTLVAAVIAVVYARDSVRSANDTAKIMDGMASNLTTTAATLKDMATDLATTATTLKDMATNLTATVATLRDMEGSLTTTVASMKANLELAERGRQEDRLVHRLGQYERVLAAILTMERAPGLFHRQERESWTREGQAMLRAAVAPLPPDELTACRHAAEAPLSEGLPQGGVVDAHSEIAAAIRAVRGELDDLLKSADP